MNLAWREKCKRKRGTTAGMEKEREKNCFGKIERREEHLMTSRQVKMHLCNFCMRYNTATARPLFLLALLSTRSSI